MKIIEMFKHKVSLLTSYVLTGTSFVTLAFGFLSVIFVPAHEIMGRQGYIILLCIDIGIISCLVADLLRYIASDTEIGQKSLWNSVERWFLCGDFIEWKLFLFVIFLINTNFLFAARRLFE